MASNEDISRLSNQSDELSPQAQFNAAVSASNASNPPLLDQQPQKAVITSLPSIYQMDADLAKQAVEQLQSTLSPDVQARSSDASQAQVNTPQYQYAPAPQPPPVPSQTYPQQWPTPSFPQFAMPVNVYPSQSHWNQQSHYTPPAEIDRNIVSHVQNIGANMYHPTPVRQFPISLHQTPPLSEKQDAASRSTTPVNAKITSASPAPSTGNTPLQKITSAVGGQVRKNHIRVEDLDDPPMCPLCYHMTCLPGSIKAHMQAIHHIPVRQCPPVRTKSQLIAAGFPVPAKIQPQRYKRCKPDDGNLSTYKPRVSGQYTTSKENGGQAVVVPAALYAPAPSANGHTAAQQESQAQTPGSVPESVSANKAKSQPRPNKLRPYLHQSPQQSSEFQLAPDRAQQLTIQQYKRQMEAHEAYQAQQPGYGMLKLPETNSSNAVRRVQANNGSPQIQGHLVGYPGVQAPAQPSYAADRSHVGGQLSHLSKEAQTAIAPAIHGGEADQPSFETTNSTRGPAEPPSSTGFSPPFANHVQMDRQSPASSFSPYTRNHLQPAQMPDMSQNELSGLSHAQMLHLFNSWPKDNAAPPESSGQNQNRQSPGSTRQQITQNLNQMIEQGQPYPETGLRQFAQASLQHISPALKHYFERTGKWPTQQEQQIAALRALNFELDQRERNAGQKRSFNDFNQDMHDTNVPPSVNRALPEQRESWTSQPNDVESQEGVATASTNASSVIDGELETDIAQEQDTPHKRQKMSYGEILVPNPEATTAQTASFDADDEAEADGDTIEVAIPVADGKASESAEASREIEKTGCAKQAEEAGDTERETLLATFIAGGAVDQRETNVGNEKDETAAGQKQA